MPSRIAPERYGGAGYTDLQRYVQVFDDFEDTAGRTTSVAGGGSVGVVGTVIPNTGIVQLATAGAGAPTGRAGIRSDGSAFAFGAGKTTFRARVQMQQLGTLGVQDASLVIGYGETNTARDQVDGVYFQYDSSIDGFWRCVTSNNSVRTTTVTTLAAVAGTWLDFRIEINAAGTEANFYIDGVLVGTNSANIPTAVNRACGMFINAIKSVGATSFNYYADFYEHLTQLTDKRK